MSNLQQPIVLQLVSICFGLLSWSLLGQLYRVAIENLKLGYDPWYGSLLLPAILVTGVAGAAIAYRGHRNHLLEMDATTQVKRFQFAGWFSLAPTITITFLWLAS
ncbi:membrane protein [Rhodopirellula maiorica SM1]|uniref:Membrane protein n=1 Tax=Rhodopirellula maiorica SM1 TaxID=1265738 RepID=M5RPC2_9BACT|nr:membrane protein [Rhodopirellula maiorica SM1]